MNLILEKDGKVYVNKLNTLFVANLPKENYDPKFDNLDILNNYEVLINEERFEVIARFITLTRRFDEQYQNCHRLFRRKRY